MNDAISFGGDVARSFAKTAQSPSRAALLGATAPPRSTQSINPSVAAWGAAPPVGPSPAATKNRGQGYFSQIGSAIADAGRAVGRDLYDFSTDPELRTRTISALGQGADKYLGTNTGMDPNAVAPRDVAPVARAQDTAAAATKAFLGNLNDRVVKPTVQFVDDATDPNKGLSAGLSAALGLDKTEPVVSVPPPRAATEVAKDYFGGLKGWAGKNPMLAGGLALGLGGLGAYGLYDLLRSRRRRNRPRYYDYDAREF